MTDAAAYLSPRLPAPSTLSSSPARRPASAGGSLASERGNASNARKGRMPRKKKLHPMDNEVGSSVLGGTLDGLPTTHRTKPLGKKKDLIEAVRKLSPMYSLSRQSLRSASLGRGNYRAAVPDDTHQRQQVTIVENGVNSSARRYHDLKTLCDRRAHELKGKLDNLQTMKAENDALQQLKHRATPESRRITVIEHEVEKIQQDIETKQHYCRVLDHMLKRLRTNEVKFDGHMNGMEDTCAQISKEENQMKLLFRQMEAGLAQAHKELEDTQRQISLDRKERELTMMQRQQEYQDAIRLQEWMIKREHMKEELATQLRGDLTHEEQLLLRDQLEHKEEQTRQLRQATEDCQKLAEELEEAFHRIKRVTGVSNLDDMVEKFASQKSNMTQLATEVKDVEERLAAVKTLKDQKDRTYMELRATGVGSVELSRETTTKLEEEIVQAKADAKTAKASMERTSGTLVALRQGAQGLLLRLQPYAHLIDLDEIDLEFTGDDAVDCLDALSTSEQILSKMLEQVGDTSPSKLQQMAAAHGLGSDAMDDNMGGENSPSPLSLQLHGPDAPSIVNNVRVKSRANMRQNDSIASFITDDHSFLDNEESMGDLTADNDGKRDDDAHVPNRVALKARSEREHAEHVRRRENEAKRKTLQERIAAADEKERAKLLSQAAKRKSQLESATRLSQAPPSPTVPPGITLRDDAMTKTSAFLTQMPDLS